MQTGEMSALLGLYGFYQLTPAIHDMSGLGLSSGTVSMCYVCHGNVIQWLECKVTMRLNYTPLHVSWRGWLSSRGGPSFAGWLD